MKTSISSDQLAFLLDAQTRGVVAQIKGLSFDSRHIQAGDLFVALKSDKADGLDYVEAASASGAVAVLVEQWVPFAITQIKVEDCLLALAEWAKSVRQSSAATFVGITGSAGKTTVKSMVAHILSAQGATHATQGNYNNEIGVPLTLLELGTEDQFAVVEMGARFKGDIAYLCALVEPNIRILTAVLPAHIETFGSIDVIAQAKGEIFDGMRPSDVAVMPGDSPHLGDWQNRAAGKIVTFGYSDTNDIRVLDVSDRGFAGLSLCLGTPVGECEVVSGLVGAHNACNIAASVAACLACGMKLEAIVTQVASIEAVQGRLARIVLSDETTLVDDSYNASPEAVRQALVALERSGGKRLAILGPMAELGVSSSDYHRQTVEQALSGNIDEVWLSGAAWPAVDDTRLRYFADTQAVIDELNSVPKFDWILVKASRSAQLDRVVAHLRALGDLAC
ncbi:MAG: UDP-N-acetylmuramoyl-tripeptide--D-alanyl-D-alanine ligase [Halieaceae bacterium]|nr:UDP-N-acetylmuramoyl-tripeptide--D-alanyl-D-alanine ligase [Halieaceae bacterium]